MNPSTLLSSHVLLSLLTLTASSPLTTLPNSPTHPLAARSITTVCQTTAYNVNQPLLCYVRVVVTRTRTAGESYTDSDGAESTSTSHGRDMGGWRTRVLMPEDSSTSTRMIGSEGEERTPVGKVTPSLERSNELEETAGTKTSDGERLCGGWLRVVGGLMLTLAGFVLL